MDKWYTGSSWLKVSWHSDRKRPQTEARGPPPQSPFPPGCWPVHPHPEPQGMATKGPGLLLARPAHTALSSSARGQVGSRVQSDVSQCASSGLLGPFPMRRAESCPLEVRTRVSTEPGFICSAVRASFVIYNFFQPEGHGGPNAPLSPLERQVCLRPSGTGLRPGGGGR